MKNVFRAYERGVQGVHRTRAQAWGARAQGARKSSGCRVKFFCHVLILGRPFSLFGQKLGPNLSEDLFFFSSPNFGQKMGPNLSEDLFFCSSPNFGGPASIFVPPWKNFSLRPWLSFHKICKKSYPVRDLLKGYLVEDMQKSYPVGEQLFRTTCFK